MGRRFRILLTVWAIGWFGYVAPAHERGFVRIDAACVGACCEPVSCCDEVADEPCDDSPGVPGVPGDPGDPVRSCAMCRLLGVLDAPVVVSIAPLPAGLVGVIDPPSPRVVVSIDVPLGRLGRAPPMVM